MILLALFFPVSRPPLSLFVLALLVPFAEFLTTLYAYGPIPLDLSQSFLYVYLQMKSIK